MRDEHTIQIPDAWLVPTVAEQDSLAWSGGRYRLCFEVASGGMATVYLALYQGPVGFERVVALKTIHPHLAKENHFIDMFLDEARIAAHIDHPFVCTVVDFGEAKNSYYIAMEYLVGEPISVIWEKLQAMPAMAASPELPFLMARIASDICEGLHAAHELTSRGRPMDIVHRDVSPANLFVLYDGTARIVDFGIAKARNKLSQTEVGTVKGKYAYVSPEQLSLRELDRRSDVFSLGVVMWEMLTGQRLFKHDAPMETMNRVMNMEIPPPSAFREWIPVELDGIVLKALSRRRSERYMTARAMANDLEEFLGSHGRTGSRAEVAEWIDDLFPGEFARKRKLIELTRVGDTAVPAVDARLEAPTGMHTSMEPTTVMQSASRPERVAEAVVVDEEPAHDYSRHLGLEDEPTDVLHRPRPSEEEEEDAEETGEVLGRTSGEDADAEDDDDTGELVAHPSSDDERGAEDEVDDASPGGTEEALDEPPLRSERGLADELTDVIVPITRRRQPRAPQATASGATERSFSRAKSRLPMIAGAVVALSVGIGAAWYTSHGPGRSQARPPAHVVQAPPHRSPPEAPELPPPEVEPPPVAQPPSEPLPGWVGPTGDVDEAPPGRAGRVQVDALGGGSGEVFYEGQRVGRTGQTITLPIGTTQLLLRPDDGVANERQLTADVRADRTVYISVTVRPE